LPSPQPKLGNPPAADIEAYTSIFAPSTNKRHVDASRFSISKRKAPHFNPYLDFWLWACQNLE